MLEGQHLPVPAANTTATIAFYGVRKLSRFRGIRATQAPYSGYFENAVDLDAANGTSYPRLYCLNLAGQPWAHAASPHELVGHLELPSTPSNASAPAAPQAPILRACTSVPALEQW